MVIMKRRKKETPNLGAPSATNTRNDLFFSFAAHRNSSTVLELPRVKITSLIKNEHSGLLQVTDNKMEQRQKGTFDVYAL